MDFVRPQSAIDAEGERLTAHERASIKGWSIDPAITPGNPHDFNACDCRTARSETATCTCLCHGRTFKHYQRGA